MRLASAPRARGLSNIPISSCSPKAKARSHFHSYENNIFVTKTHGNFGELHTSNLFDASSF